MLSGILDLGLELYRVFNTGLAFFRRVIMLCYFPSSSV